MESKPDLRATIGRVRRAMPRNPDAAEATLVKLPVNTTVNTTAVNTVNTAPVNTAVNTPADRKAYMRDYMRRRRAKPES
jgi:hypothetical protein